MTDVYEPDNRARRSEIFPQVSFRLRVGWSERGQPVRDFPLLEPRSQADHLGDELNRRNGDGGKARERRGISRRYQPPAPAATLV